MSSPLHRKRYATDLTETIRPFLFKVFRKKGDVESLIKTTEDP
ncbi:hypothetical protein [Dictyobacter vulcani]|nr:hypothetical protein [Dictyobacter vulcani]